MTSPAGRAGTGVGVERRTGLVVSVHDVSPATAGETAQWCADADALGIPVSLLVAPGPWRGTSLAGEPGDATVPHRRVAGGDELVPLRPVRRGHGA